MYHARSILRVVGTHPWPLTLQYSSHSPISHPLTECVVSPALGMLVTYSFLQRVSLSLLSSAVLKSISLLHAAYLFLFLFVEESSCISLLPVPLYNWIRKKKPQFFVIKKTYLYVWIYLSRGEILYLCIHGVQRTTERNQFSHHITSFLNVEFWSSQWYIPLITSISLLQKHILNNNIYLIWIKITVNGTQFL